MIQNASTIHYRTVLDVESSDGLTRRLQNHLRSWLDYKRVPKLFFNDTIFLSGGKSASHDKSLVLETEILNESVHGDSLWGMRLTENCKQYPNQRKWVTDVVIKASSAQRAFLSIVTRFHDNPNYFGPKLDVPTITTPSLVMKVLSDPQLTTKMGDYPVSEDYVTISKNDIEHFREIVFSAGRRYPIIYCSMDLAGNFLLDILRLSKGLLGNALVCVAESRSIDTDINAVFPDKYRVFHGDIKIYFPNITAASPMDYRRHKYFNRSDLLTLGEAAILEIVVTGICRNPRAWIDFPTNTIDDIRSTIRDLQMIAARQEIRDNTTNELFEKFDDIFQERDRLAAAVQDLEMQALERDEEIEALVTENSRLQYQILERTESVSELTKQIATDSTLKAVFEALSEMPGETTQVIEQFEKISEGKIVFYESVKKKFRSKKTSDIYDAWSSLHVILYKLIDILFDRTIDDKVGEFNRLSSTYKFGRTEGSATKQDSKLIRARTFSYEGQEYIAFPHIKDGTRPNYLFRVYFGIDDQNKRVIVFHMGDHLENAATRKV